MVYEHVCVSFVAFTCTLMLLCCYLWKIYLEWNRLCDQNKNLRNGHEGKPTITIREHGFVTSSLVRVKYFPLYICALKKILANFSVISTKKKQAQKCTNRNILPFWIRKNFRPSSSSPSNLKILGGGRGFIYKTRVALATAKLRVSKLRLIINDGTNVPSSSVWNWWP